MEHGRCATTCSSASRRSVTHAAIRDRESTRACAGCALKVLIGVDPHKLSATIEVVDQHEQLLGSGRFTTDKSGYAAMRNYAKSWPDRVWAVEGANGVGRPLAQRLLEAGEQVVDVPAKLAARVRLFDTGHNRKTDRRPRRLRRPRGRRRRRPQPEPACAEDRR